ncbi:hypothetical protein RHSIM_Rhsim09G0095300 [Rhododendron simsii]|uniref:Uncharacterized protein n=1 Tax=Rhododendron simsii TaxID=118357 RepID=A0A834LF21_RHOSS|nr:hypothetical protein RHSIM_Rhsim09G0095300 [Rhododendron simsii]
MALAGKMEAEVEIKSGGPEILNFLGGKNSHHLPDVVPEQMPKVDLHEEGKVETYKEKITIDDENEAIHLTAH